MPSLTVKIEWGKPKDERWLNADNVAICLNNCCSNTKFKVSEVLQVFGARIEVCNELTASEALHGFVGWLTSRSEETTMSGHHDAGKPSDLVGEFIKANQLSAPRDGWQYELNRDDWQIGLSEIKEGGPVLGEPRTFRWRLYNLAFRVFGNTRLWPKLGRKIWN